MKQRIIGAVLLAVASVVLVAQERVDLSVAEQPPSNPNYHVERLILDFDAGFIYINLRGVNGEEKLCIYSPVTNPTGTFLLTALNKSNLSSAYAGNGTTGSLKQRIFHRLVVMNEATAVCKTPLTGSLAGSVP